MVGTTISHYRILEKIGGGGMGIVYKAQDLKLDRHVALKFLPFHLTTSEEEKQRFIHEAKAASSLDHNNICAIYEIDETEDGQLFISMAYYDGETLDRRIKNKPLTIEESIDIANQIAQGLAKAHEKKIVHRDIKPANMIILKDNTVKILDFGLAKLTGQSKITKEKSTLGTVAYTSPEQTRGEDVNALTDIWSLGVMLYEMLTGKLPFKGDYEQAVVYSILNEDPESIINLNEDVSITLQQVIFKMLKKDRNQRFQNMNEVVTSFQDLRNEMQGEKNGEKAKTIAVLPFENISPEKENEYFSDGLTEELIVNLSRLKNMKVVSRTTSMQYKGTKKNIKTIGKELRARYILEGSVRKYQDNLRISVQLIDVETDTHLWAETYKGKLADVFDIQEQVAKQIVDALLLKLTVTEKVVLTKRSTLNAEAFDYNLRAREFLYQLTKNKVKIAIQLFEKAVEIDPRYASAYAGLGHAYALLFQLFERNKSLLDKSIELSLKALMYDASLSEAYASLCLAYYNNEALEEALEVGQKAIELDPNNYIAYWILGRIYRSTDRNKEAINLFQKVTALNPDFFTAYSDLSACYNRQGMKKEHDEILQTVLKIFPKYLFKHPDDGRAHMFYAIELATVGKKKEAKDEAAKALELDPADPLMQYNAACFYAQIGEKQLALKSLKVSVATGYQYYEWIKRDPDLDNIREEPEYMELMKGK